VVDGEDFWDDARSGEEQFLRPDPQLVAVLRAGPHTPPLLTSTSTVCVTELTLTLTETTLRTPQKVLTLSREVEECAPLARGAESAGVPHGGAHQHRGMARR